MNPSKMSHVDQIEENVPATFDSIDAELNEAIREASSMIVELEGGDSELHQSMADSDATRQAQKMGLEEILEKAIPRLKSEGKMDQARKMQTSLAQFRALRSYSPLFNKRYYSKCKNLKEYKARMPARKKKAFGRLIASKKFTFISPDMAFVSLKERLPEDKQHLAKYVLEIIFNIIIDNKTERFAVFISQLLNRIYFLKKDNYDEALLSTLIKAAEKRAKKLPKN